MICYFSEHYIALEGGNLTIICENQEKLTQKSATLPESADASGAILSESADASGAILSEPSVEAGNYDISWSSKAYAFKRRRYKQVYQQFSFIFTLSS